MFLESAAEALQVRSSDEEPRGAAGNRTQATPHRPWRHQLCLRVSCGTLCLPAARQESRSPQTQHCLDAQSQPWPRTVTGLFVPPAIGLWFFFYYLGYPKMAWVDSMRILASISLFMEYLKKIAEPCLFWETRSFSDFRTDAEATAKCWQQLV